MLIPLVIISAAIAGGLLVAAWSRWRANGPLSNSLCVMLLAIAAEIVFAIVADRYLPSDLEAFAQIKTCGRIVEAFGVGYFLWCLSRSK